MSEVVRTAEVAAPPDAVWKVLADFGAISAWAPNADHSCLMGEQTEGVGTVRRIQAGRTTLLETVETWDPPTTLSYSLAGLPPVVRSASNTWQIAEAPGGSRVTLTSRVDAGPRPPQKLIARIVGRVLARASDQMLAALKERVT